MEGEVRMHGTCIVGIVHKRNVWMGCDSMVSSESYKFTYAERKLFRVGEDVLFGIAGWPRIKDVIEYGVAPPERPENCGPREYIVKHLVPALRAAISEAGAMGKDENTDDVSASLLVAYDGRLFTIEGGFTVFTVKDTWCIGSGAEYALGSLHATRAINDPAKRIRLALEAAAHYSPSVAPPFHIEKL